MKEAPFEKLIVRRQWRRKPSIWRRLQAVGLDTESLDGYCALIADSRGRARRVNSFDDIVSFLTYKGYQGKACFFYNLKYDAETVIKWLGKDLCREVLRKKRIRVNGAEIEYIPKRLLAIRKGHKTWRFYDLANFFEHSSLDKAASAYLGKGKRGIENLEEKLRAGDKEVEEYCLEDARLAGELGEFLLSSFEKLGVYPKRLTSCGAVAAREALIRCTIPRGDKIPKGALEYAYKAMRGGWVEAYARGYFKKVYVYDLQSAYPWALSQLPNMLKGFWIRRKGDYPKGKPWLRWGFVKAGVIFKSRDKQNRVNLFHPLAVKFGGLNIYPAGSWEVYLTLDEARYLEEKGLFLIKYIEGWYFVPRDDEDRPLKEFIEDLYRKRAEAKERGDTHAELAAKLLLNSLAGKFMERNPDGNGSFVTGNFFNPAWASWMLALVRLRVLDAALKDHRPILMVSTDSIWSSEPLDLDLGPGLGRWRLQAEAEALIWGAGIYTLRNGDIKTKHRGFKVHEDIDLFELIEKEPDKTEYLIPYRSPYPLAFAVFQDRFEDACKFLDNSIKLPVDLDQKRQWFGQPETGRDLLESQFHSFPLTYYGDRIFKVKLRRKDGGVGKGLRGDSQGP